jgi:hypothetical protein
MSLTNDSNISLEIHKKPNILYDEVDLISSNRRVKNSTSIVISPKNKKKENSSEDFVYGTSIDIHNPRNIGATKAFLYINGFPIIIIGPDCK